MEDKELAKKATESEAREVAEAAREKEWTRPSFLRELFMGRFDISLIHPHPEQDPEEEARAREFLDKLAEFLRARVDSEAIDREGRISEEIVEELRRMGAFGIKIPREYGGLGFSQLTYNRAMALVGSKDGSLGGAALRPSIHWRPTAAEIVRHTGAEKEIHAQAGQRSHLGLCPDGSARRFRPGQHVDNGGSRGRRKRFHSERRKALVHERHSGGIARGHGPYAAQGRRRKGKAADNRVYRGGGLAGSRGRAPLPFHGSESH